jgi:hypothetical protein
VLIFPIDLLNVAVSAIFKEKAFGGNDQFINPLNYPAAPYWVMFAYKQLAGQGILAGKKGAKIHAFCRWEEV